MFTMYRDQLWVLAETQCITLFALFYLTVYNLVYLQLSTKESSNPSLADLLSSILVT